ncbi:MAG: hypothetical protein QXP36_08525 [Conexivisphaerales archaeon]
MKWRTNVKAVSTLLIIILMIISAIVGGIVSYAFTIAYYAKKPQGTALTITDVYIDKENVDQFTINVLNPSYSPTDATISKIAISLEGETQLYDVVETRPPLENGIVIPIGESKNITCVKIKKDNTNATLGELIGRFGFAGKSIIVHIFSLDSTAANIRTKLPFVQLNINLNFDPRISVKKCNITLTSDPQSEVNVTVTRIDIWGVIDAEISPNVEEQPITIPKNGSQEFRVNITWSGVSATIPLIVKTKQGYIFRKEFELKGFSVFIKSVDFSKEDTSHFNVTIFNSDASASYVNVTKIRCRLDNGTYLDPFECGSAGIMLNMTRTFIFNWEWKEYRNRTIMVIAYFLQGFEMSFNATTPPPIIVEVLNKASVFNLKDRGHLNITIQNHVSSLEAINVTKIVAKGVILNGTKVDPSLPYGPIAPGDHITFTCDFNWTSFVSTTDRNLTLTVHIVTSTSLKEYTFDFTFVLPVAELNITSVGCVEDAGVKYLNVTIKNMDYSLWNLTLSKIVIKVGNATNTLEYVLPKNQVTVNVGEEITLLCPFDWQKYSNEDIVITVLTDESVGTSSVYHIP